MPTFLQQAFKKKRTTKPRTSRVVKRKSRHGGKRRPKRSSYRLGKESEGIYRTTGALIATGAAVGTMGLIGKLGK